MPGHLFRDLQPDPIDDVSPILRREFDAADLMRGQRPRLHSANKQLVLEIACPPDATFHGTVGFSRWSAMDPPPSIAPIGRDLLVPRPGYYDYRPVPVEEHATEWHVNFADRHLFVAYAGSLFAQDEMQVAEHPVLAALKQALDAAGLDSRTGGDAGPTPVLVSGVERRVSIATDPDAAAGRHHGLYGNQFARADPDVIRAAVERIEPPSITNLIAMVAPSGGRGVYRREEIERTLVTAYTGLRAAVLETRRTGPGRATVVHTGFWGCGAFGGNRVLMALLQLVAADMAGLDALVFHTGPAGNERPLADAVDLATTLISLLPIPTSEFLDRVEQEGFRWGVSNGT